MRLRSSPTHQPTDHQLKCLYIQLFRNPFPWGQGIDSVNYPGPSIHPIMSLKMYILLYTYVTYYGINLINICVFCLCKQYVNKLTYLINNTISADMLNNIISKYYIIISG